MNRWLMACAACLLVGLAVGRYTVTPKASELHTESMAESAELHTESIEESSELAFYAATETATERTETATEKIRIVYRERLVQADGATEERELELDAETARLLSEAETYREEVESLRLQLASQRSSEALIQATLDLRRHLIPAQQDWRVSALIGIDIPRVQATYGASIERRVLGPIHVGAWGLSSGSLGASVGVAW